MIKFLILAVVAASLAAGSSVCRAAGPSPTQIKNLVTFGDSYTDVVAVADGGTAWPVYAARYGGFQLFPFARSGAVCSNNISLLPSNSVFESQLPLYFADKANGTLPLNPNETMYTLWIGTNDLGVNALLRGGGANGTTVVDVMTCAVNWVKTLYQSGARNFLFQNMIPLQKTILYSADTYPNPYWTGEHDAQMWSIAMTEMVQTGNEISKLMLQALPATYPGAHIGLFDSHSLIEDIIANPSAFLNGTAPLNVTGAVKSCVYHLNESTSDPANCTIATGTDRDSFLWFDELHPSEQTDRIVAREIAAAINRNSSNYTTWFS